MEATLSSPPDVELSMFTRVAEWMDLCGLIIIFMYVCVPHLKCEECFY